MSAPQRFTDAEILAAYEKHGNVHKAAAELGCHTSSFHERLVKLGRNRAVNVFCDAERERLQRDYALYRRFGRVAELAADMGRTVPFLSRQARALGLTDASHEREWHGKWKYLSEDAATVLWEEFKRSRYTLAQFCSRNSLDDDGFRRAMRRFFSDEWEHVIEAKAPRTGKYRDGRQFEYRTRDHLQTLGYFVMRSPASKSPIDLVAIRRGEVLLVQCKKGGALPPGEWNELFDLADSVGAVPILAACPAAYGVECWRLLERKDGSKRRQPMERVPALSRGRAKTERAAS